MKTRVKKLNRINKFFLLFLFLFYPSLGLSSLVIVKNISLEELIKTTPLIVIAKKIEPFSHAEKIAISKTNKKNPLFSVVYSHYQIIEVLKQNPNELIEKNNIETVDEYIDSRFNLHKKYYIDKISVSPLYKHYQSELLDEVKPGDPVILFLSYPNQSWNQAYYEKAFESLSKKKEVLKIISSLLVK